MGKVIELHKTAPIVKKYLFGKIRDTRIGAMRVVSVGKCNVYATTGQLHSLFGWRIPSGRIFNFFIHALGIGLMVICTPIVIIGFSIYLTWLLYSSLRKGSTNEK